MKYRIYDSNGQPQVVEAPDARRAKRLIRLLYGPRAFLVGKAT